MSTPVNASSTEIPVEISVVKQKYDELVKKSLLLGQPILKNLPQKRNQAVRNTNVLKPGMFRIASTPIQTRTPQLPHASRNTNPLCLNLQELFTRLSLADHSLSAIKLPISASKPKRKSEKSVATPHKKTVASVTTIQKSKSYYKKLYENTNPEWRWWIAKRCPSAYTWTQKPLRTKKIWMPKVRKDDESTSISPTIDIVSRITMPRSSMFTRRLIAADQASVFMEMTSVHISSGLVLYQMTFDHNRSELGIQDQQQ
ncbi:hypothetical protein Tco_0704705 [Tanacetum coccineum]|uniref:Uncharacterized protein n=1 Tax=Tanacetum coccineum TaxID=301880 RepID=A0ABQ4Y2K9_9ASTR